MHAVTAHVKEVTGDAVKEERFFVGIGRLINCRNEIVRVRLVMCHAATILVIHTQKIVLAAIWINDTRTTSNRNVVYRSWQLPRKLHHVKVGRGTVHVAFVAPPPRVPWIVGMAGKEQSVTRNVQPVVVGKCRFVVAGKGYAGEKLFVLRLQIDHDEHALRWWGLGWRIRHRRRGKGWW